MILSNIKIMLTESVVNGQVTMLKLDHYESQNFHV